MMLDLCRLCLVCLNGLWLHGKDRGEPIDEVYMLYGSGRPVCDGGQDGNKGGMKGISRLKRGRAEVGSSLILSFRRGVDEA